MKGNQMKMKGNERQRDWQCKENERTTVFSAQIVDSNCNTLAQFPLKAFIETNTVQFAVYTTNLQQIKEMKMEGNEMTIKANETWKETRWKREENERQSDKHERKCDEHERKMNMKGHERQSDEHERTAVFNT